MSNEQFFTLVGMLAAGFGWVIFWLRSIDKDLNDVKTRVTVIETILGMMGAPIKIKQKEE